MTSPKLDLKISIGNIVSWAIVIIGFIVGYVRLQDASAQTQKDVASNREIAITATKLTAQYRETAIGNDAILTEKFYSLKTDTEVIKANLKSIDKKLDELSRGQKMMQSSIKD